MNRTCLFSLVNSCRFQSCDLEANSRRVVRHFHLEGLKSGRFGYCTPFGDTSFVKFRLEPVEKHLEAAKETLQPTWPLGRRVDFEQMTVVSPVGSRLGPRVLAS